MRFKLFGVQIEICFSFVAVVCLFLITDKTGLAAASLFACLLHELCHIISFCLIKKPPQKLVFEASGIRLVRPTALLSRKEEVTVQLAGCFGNFTAALFCCFMAGFNSFSALNLFVAFFNLLPLKSLDGGKLLKLFFTCFLSEPVSEKLCLVFDIVFSALFFLLAVYMIFTRRVNITLLIFALFLVYQAVAGRINK